ncbi:transcriptional activator NhaR [Planctomycetia bacterium]|nr:transcriptional activator NhaR [Planctomycetia bacterium]
MTWLNYHHLHYFWVVAREGTIQNASQLLHVGQPAISTQLHQLEQSLGQKLFRRVGRRLELTDAGRTVFRYAEQIFSLGREMTDLLKTGEPAAGFKFVVGVADAMPKLMVRRLLEPALQLSADLRLICVEHDLGTLLTELGRQSLDLVLSDAPLTPAGGVKAFNHLLGQSGVGLFGTPHLVAKVRTDFPASLNRIPLLLPGRNTALRRSLESWLESHDVSPVIRGEFDDKALLKAFGQTGEGLFPGTLAIADEICRQYEVQLAGELEGVVEHFYAISVERRIRHPAVLAISSSAKSTIFA